MSRQSAVSPADPATLAWLANATRNRAALTTKQIADSVRVRVRFDVPKHLKDQLARAAADLHTSSSQLGAFAICWFLLHYEWQTDDMIELMEFVQSRSIRHQCDIDLQPIADLLTNSAEGPK